LFSLGIFGPLEDGFTKQNSISARNSVENPPDFKGLSLS
jgi:hypothetical protein